MTTAESLTSPGAPPIAVRTRRTVTRRLAPFLFVLYVLNSINILKEYERAVVFRLGRLVGSKGPGIVLLVPLIDRMVRVDLRTVTFEVPPQDVITRDNVTVKVNAVVYFRVVDATKSVIEVENTPSQPNANSARAEKPSIQRDSPNCLRKSTARRLSLSVSSSVSAAPALQSGSACSAAACSKAWPVSRNSPAVSPAPCSWSLVCSTP